MFKPFKIIDHNFVQLENEQNRWKLTLILKKNELICFWNQTKETSC